MRALFSLIAERSLPRADGRHDLIGVHSGLKVAAFPVLTLVMFVSELEIVPADVGGTTTLTLHILNPASRESPGSDIAPIWTNTFRIPVDGVGAETAFVQFGIPVNLSIEQPGQLIFDLRVNGASASRVTYTASINDVDAVQTSEASADSPVVSGVIARKRNTTLGFHYQQGCAWLDLTAGGANTSALAYAAFEFRLELERVALELFIRIRGKDFDPNELRTLSNFKTIEKRIYSLGGHQRTIDRTIQFFNCVLLAAGAKFSLARVDVGTLSRHWHRCSEFCHIRSTLALAGNGEFVGLADSTLEEVRDFLAEVSKSVIAWGRPEEPGLKHLYEGFVAGAVTASDVRAHLGETGVWGLFTAPDGTRTFLSDLRRPESV